MVRWSRLYFHVATGIYKHANANYVPFDQINRPARASIVVKGASKVIQVQAPPPAASKVEGLASDLTACIGNTPMVFLNRVVGKVRYAIR